MNNKKIFLFAFLSFFLVGCDSTGGVNLTDTRGNKYTFKNESVTCYTNIHGDIKCIGSAIKKDIGGQRFTTQFSEKVCLGYYSNTFANGKYVSFYTGLEKDVLCQAANQLGKISPLKTEKEVNVPERYR